MLHEHKLFSPSRLDYPATGSGKWGQLEVKVGCIVTMNIESNDLFVLYYIIYE